MSSVTPDRFLKHVNLRTRQLITDRDEAIKDRFIERPEHSESKLMDAIKSRRLDTRDKIRKEAEAILKKTGSETQIPDTLLRSLQKVFEPESLEEKAAAFKEEFSKTPVQYLKQASQATALQNAWERLYCLSVVPENTNRNRDNAIIFIKAHYAIQRLADAESAEEVLSLPEAMALRVLVAKALFPAASRPKPNPSEADGKLLRQIEKLLDDAQNLLSIKNKVSQEDKNFHYRGEGAFIEPTITRSAPERRREGADNLPAGNSVNSASSEEPKNWLLERIAKETKALGTAAAKRNLFSESELKLLNLGEANLLGNTELGGIRSLENELYKNAKALVYHPGMATSAEVAKNSATMQLIKLLNLPKIKLIKGGFDSSSSATLPRVHQLGVGDLHVLEQQINRYEMGEVAHIENVMGKESRNRTHTRLEETENTYTTETEETITDERSLQTTDRYELSKESEKQSKATLEASAGFSISASYGAVTASASGNIASSLSTSSTQSTSTNFSREIVDKSVSEITSRVREESVTRVLTRIEEVNSHGFNNDTSSHIIGIYRWVDKYYTVRNVNYGRRLMLEMIIPEPAAGYLYAEQMHPEHDEIAPPPDPISFDPEYLTRSNYLDYMAEYNATDVTAPPEDIVYKSVSLVNRSNEYTIFADKDSSVSVPEGYKTTNFYGRWQYLAPSDKDDDSIDIIVGGVRYGSTSTLTGQTGNIAVSVLAHCSAYHTGIRIRCELTDQAFENWQAECWSSLQSAYAAAVSDYESKVAAAEIGAGVEIHGRNPDQNEEIIRTELKRCAIKYLSNDMAEIIVNGTVRNNEVFDAADSTGDFDLDEAKIEGSIIQFFEQAFEWENMMWKFYPYIWARQSEQHDKLLDEDTDPVFREFRRAGAARVVLPVPIDYQEAVLHFFETNEVWQGGEPPVLDDPEYLSIIDDLMDGQLNSFNSPIYYQDEDSVPPYIVDEWEIKLPTSLVKLQEDSELPNFTTSLIETDAETVLDELATDSGFSSEWRNSIINLLTLLGLETSEEARREMAIDNGYPCNGETDPIHNINEWLYDFLLASISAHGLPD